ncbi:MAG: hypothetical protein AB7H90_18820 [Alphaproteobacteria bacterium]
MSGVVVAAILALAMPAWADAPGNYRSDMRGQGMSMSQAKKAQAARGSQRNMNRAAMRQWDRPAMSRMGAGASPTDNVANELNRMEAQRLMTGGSTPPMGGPAMAPMGGPNMAPMGAPPPRPIPGQ